MLPDDDDWFANSGNHVISKEWTNAIQLATDAVAADGSVGTFPAPSGTTLPWGGGKIVVFKSTNKVGDGSGCTVDASLDYRNRLVVVLAFGAYTDPGGDVLLPGEASYSSAGGPGYTFPFDSGFNHLWTSAGSDPPTPPATNPGDPYLTLCTTGDDIALFCKSTENSLYLWNESGSDIYPFLICWVSDQFPTRT